MQSWPLSTRYISPPQNNLPSWGQESFALLKYFITDRVVKYLKDNRRYSLLQVKNPKGLARTRNNLYLSI